MIVETKILDEFPPWSIYIVALAVASGFLISVLFFIRSRHRPAHKRPMFGESRHPTFVPLFFCIISALASWYLITSMFYRFHAISIERDRIALLYLWPQRQETIHKSDLLAVSLIRGYRPCGYMEVATRERTFLSVNFRHCAVANEILEEIGIGQTH